MRIAVHFVTRHKLSPADLTKLDITKLSPAQQECFTQHLHNPAVQAQLSVDELAYLALMQENARKLRLTEARIKLELREEMKRGGGGAPPRRPVTRGPVAVGDDQETPMLTGANRTALSDVVRERGSDCGPQIVYDGAEDDDGNEPDDEDGEFDNWEEGQQVRRKLFYCGNYVEKEFR